MAAFLSTVDDDPDGADEVFDAGAGPGPITDHDLDQLAAALELTQAAIANRTRWHSGQDRY